MLTKSDESYLPSISVNDGPLNITNKKTFLYGSKSVQVKSITDWNNIIDKKQFTFEDFVKLLWGYQKTAL